MLTFLPTVPPNARLAIGTTTALLPLLNPSKRTRNSALSSSASSVLTPGTTQTHSPPLKVSTPNPTAIWGPPFVIPALTPAGLADKEDTVVEGLVGGYMSGTRDVRLITDGYRIRRIY